MNGTRSNRSGRNRLAWPLAILMVLILVLVVLRMMLPEWVRDYLNNQIDELDNYSGHIEEVDMHLWRGAYTVKGIDIHRVDRDVQAPFLVVDEIEFTVDWGELWQGTIVAEAVIRSPVVNIVDLGDGVFQAGEGVDWREVLEEFMPIEIDHVRVVDGRVHYRNFDSEPPIDLEISDIEMTIIDLSTEARDEGARFATVQAEGLALNHAPLELAARIDPLSDFHDFEIQFRVTDVDLTLLNPLTEVYGNFDFEAGTGSLVMEVLADDAQLSGYARPILDDVEILDLEERLDEDGLLEAAWEGLVAAVSQILRHQPEDRIAAEIDISGDLDDEEISGWQAFVSILRNAFAEAYTEEFGREDV